MVALDLEHRLIVDGHEVVGVPATDRGVRDRGGQGRRPALMDVAVAGGSNGIAAAARLCAEFGVPSLFVTATLPDRPEVHRYGLGHLHKPFTGEDLMELWGKPRPRCVARTALCVRSVEAVDLIRWAP